MRQGIVIVTSESTKDFLADCINSCWQLFYEITIVSNGGFIPNIPELKLPMVNLVVNDWNGFELGGIVRGMECFDEFLLLHDTMIIKNQSIFDIIFKQNEGNTVYFSQDLNYHYSAKFRTEILKKMQIPRVNNKRDAIDNERSFGNKYLETETAPKILIEPISPGAPGMPIIERHKRQGIVVGNSYIEKHKTNY